MPTILILVGMSFSHCGSFTKPNGGDVLIPEASSGSNLTSNCDYGVRLFNQQVAGAIKSDIQLMYAKQRIVPEDLKRLYPAARDVWNRAIIDVKNNYSDSYAATSLNVLSTAEINDWQSNDLADYQKFFLLLTEYSHGAYPADTRDTMTKQGWMEKADPKRRLEAYIKNMITRNCNPSNSRGEIKKLLDPDLLPDSIEECLE